jgi:hypothetical protein
MEGIERLSLTDDILDDDPVLTYTPEQLHRHEATEMLLTIRPLEGVVEQIWFHWHQNELFFIDTIHWLRLKARTWVGSNLSPTRVEHLAPPAVMDTGQPGSMPTRGQPLTQMVTIDDAMPFRILISNDAKVSIMSLQVFLTL